MLHIGRNILSNVHRTDDYRGFLEVIHIKFPLHLSHFGFTVNFHDGEVIHWLSLQKLLPRIQVQTASNAKGWKKRLPIFRWSIL